MKLRETFERYRATDAVDSKVKLEEIMSESLMISP